MNFKKIVVTGGKGFLGRHVVEQLRADGREVHSCSRRDGVDLRDRDAFTQYLQTLRPDCVVHCAAHVGGIAYVRNHAVEVFEDNLRIALGLAGGVAAAGTPMVVNIMPNCVYPGNRNIYREAEWWDGPLHDSVLMYGLPRKTLWGLVRTYGRQHGLRCRHLILPNLYGPYDHFDPEKSHALGALVAKVVDAARSGNDRVEIWGSGRPVREWLYVEDAAAAVARYLKVLEDGPDKCDEQSDDPGGVIYNVGIGQGISIRDLAETIRRVADWNGRFEFDTDRPDGAPHKRLDGSRFADLTGWQPRTSLDQGIARTVAFYQAACRSASAHGHQAVQPQPGAE